MVIGIKGVLLEWYARRDAHMRGKEKREEGSGEGAHEEGMESECDGDGR